MSGQPIHQPTHQPTHRPTHRPTHGPTHRVSPFHCPYCGDQDLFPREEQGWECRSCLRAFAVTFLGQLDRPASASGGGTSPGSGGPS